jgi:peroxin-19
MKELVSKELLAEPMKELGDNYPVWLSENKDIISTEDYKRYTDQHAIILKINEVFATCGDELTAAQGEEVTRLMQEMQALGEPPGDLTNILGATGDATADDQLPPDCKTM